jgi:hypothetical protein
MIDTRKFMGKLYKESSSQKIKTENNAKKEKNDTGGICLMMPNQLLD